MNEAELIDRYIDALNRDPNALPPPGLDADTVAFVRALVESEQRPAPSTSAQDRVWHRAMSLAESPPTPGENRRASSRGNHIEQRVTILKSNDHLKMEDSDMDTHLSQPLETFMRVMPGTRPPRQRYYWQYTLTIAAALVILALLGGILIEMVNDPIDGYPAVEALQTEEPKCAAESVTDATAESVRLAEAANALFDTQALVHPPEIVEQATLLATCALQTAYTPEADQALQQALSLTDALQQFKGHTWFVNGLAFSPDGQYLYSASADQSIRVWDLRSRTEMTQYQANMVGSLALSPDGRYLVTGEWGGEAWVRDIQTGEVIRTFSTGGGSAIIQLFFSSDEKYLLTGNQGGLLKLWDFSTGAELQTYPSAWGGSLSSDGRYVATVDAGQVHIYNVGESEPVAAIDFTLPPAGVWGTISPDGRYLLVSGGTATQRIEPPAVLLLDRETGAEVRRFEGHTGEVYAGFSPDGKYVLSWTSYDGTMRLWDAETGQQLRIFTSQIFTVKQGRAASMVLSPDGRQVAIGYETGMVVMWPVDYHDMLTLACEHITRDFTADERAEYSLGDGAACP
jgi:Tol biopolymer transport system component